MTAVIKTNDDIRLDASLMPAKGNENVGPMMLLHVLTELSKTEEVIQLIEAAAKAKSEKADFDWTMFINEQIKTNMKLMTKIEEVVAETNMSVQDVANHLGFEEALKAVRANESLKTVSANALNDIVDNIMDGGNNKPVDNIMKPIPEYTFKFRFNGLAALKELIGDMDPREITIAYIFLAVSLVAMEYREVKAQELAEAQRTQNDVTTRFNQYLYLMRQIQSDSVGRGEVGIPNGGTRDSGKIADELREAARQLFGDDARIDDKGNLIPGKGSELEKFLRSLERNGEPGDALKNPVYSLINNFARNMFQTWTAPLKPTDTDYAGPKPERSFGESLLRGDIQDLVKWVNVMGFNHYYQTNRNENIKPGTDFVGINVTQSSSVQSSLGVLSQQNTAEMQTILTELETFSGIVKKMLDSVADLIKSVNQRT